jgi:hypothetical protein
MEETLKKLESEKNALLQVYTGYWENKLRLSP